MTSLTTSAGGFTLTQVRDAMMSLPNLDDLSLSGSLIPVDRRISARTILKGGFRGRLRLLRGFAHEDVINMLLEVPTGLHFTRVEVRGVRECLLASVRLVEACGRSLVKLSYAASFHGKSYPFPQPS